MKPITAYGLLPGATTTSRGSIDERRLGKRRKAREDERLLGYRPRAADSLRQACGQGTAVGSEHDVRVEQACRNPR